MNTYSPSELILREDGSVYHLALQPEQVAPTIITVGDPERVKMVSDHFDSIDHKVAQREFHTHTGTLNGKALSVISTGIGTDNIDIVLNELDALFNIDLERRTERPQHTQLNLIRIGTSGSLQADIPVDSFVCSAYALGLDGLLPFYQACEEKQALDQLSELSQSLAPGFLASMGCRPYFFKGDTTLLAKLGGPQMTRGITATCTGFYAPQGRQLRLKSTYPDLLDKLASGKLTSEGLVVSNFEMETAGIYGLGSLLGHRCISLNAILANRALGTFSSRPAETVNELIKQTLARLTAG